MMQRRRPQHVETPLPAEVLPAPAATAAGPIRVVAGADVQDLDLAGRTVAEARTIARTLFGISPRARALVDGHEVQEGHLLGAGTMLEFVRHAGQKGAGTLHDLLTAWTGQSAAGAERVAAEPPTPAAAAPAVIEIAGAEARWKQNGDVGAETTLGELLTRVASAGSAPEAWRVHPRQVRVMVERDRGRTVGVVIEMPPGPRHVRWAERRSRSADESEPRGRARGRWLSFPWVVLIVVFVDGEMVNLHQAFYRPAPIASLDDALYFTNLLNVARGYGQESWVCLLNLEHTLATLGWEQRVSAVTRHFWEAAYNRSADLNEGPSYWTTSRDLDARLASVEAWEEATTAAPYFALEVAWRPTGRTLGETLAAMLDVAAPWRPIEHAEQLATLMQRSGG